MPSLIGSRPRIREISTVSSHALGCNFHGSIYPMPLPNLMQKPKSHFLFVPIFNLINFSPFHHSLNFMLSYISPISVLALLPINNDTFQSQFIYKYIYFSSMCNIFLQHLDLFVSNKLRTLKRKINGRLGWGGYRLYPVCVVFPWITIPTARQRQTSGLRQFPNKCNFHICSFPFILWLYGYLPHCH